MHYSPGRIPEGSLKCVDMDKAVSLRIIAATTRLQAGNGLGRLLPVKIYESKKNEADNG